MLADITAVLTVITPIGVALIGLRAERIQKENKRINELEAELRAKEKADLNSTISMINSGINEIQTTIQDMRGDVDTIRNMNTAQDNLIQNLSAMNQLNSKCTNELAQLVMTLAEGMRDQHLDGNITRAVSEYRNFESTTLHNLISK